MNFGVLASTGPTMRNLRTPRHAEATVDRFNGAGARVPGMIRLVRHSIALVAAGLAAALSGCDSHNSGSLGADPRQVTVFGSGQVQGVPDTLIADVGIQVTAADVRVTVAPQYSNPEPAGTATITGYRADNDIEVKIHPTDAASRLLALVVSTGGDATRISSVSYSIGDDSQLVKDARARAFQDAKNRADQYAQLSGLRLGKVISISEASGAAPTHEAPAPPRGLSAVPLEPGQQTVGFSVTVVWELT